MTLKEIKKAVNSALKERYPDMKIYGADTVEGYTRPSFFVYITQTFSESKKNTNEADGMNFFASMEEMFGQKLTIGSRSLNTSNMDLNFQGENANIPVCQFDVEFWDVIPRTDSSKLMEELKLSQEVKQGDYQ